MTPAPPLSALPARVGETMPPSEWLTITQAMIDDFARITGDRQWIHTEPERCKLESPYGAPIAHGLFVLSLIPATIAAGPPWAVIGTGINYGCDKVRFPAAIRVGRRIRVCQTLKAAEPFKGPAMKVTIAVTVEIEDETAPACYAEIIALLMP